ncbi:MAG: hypothetical protein IPM77_01090 [Crocinitomicaceae bacterium]|nr:hypothetical protein [Crocinitomicaceae bacterium]
MKSLFFIGLILSLNSIYAQWTTDSIIHSADSVHQAYKQRMIDMYEHVDLTQVPSGILYDRGIPFITFEPFQGVVNDSSEATELSFGLAYASLSSMVVDPTKNLTNPSYYREKMDTIKPESNFITVAGLHYNYHFIDTNSIANGQFQIIDNNIYDIFPHTGSPYIQREFFMFSPAVHKISSNTLKLFIDSTLFFTNTGKEILSLAIDFGIDSGFVNTSFNRTVANTYDEEGWKNITIKITYTDSSEYFSNFEIYTKGPEVRAGGDNIFDIYHYIPPTYGSAPDEGRGGGTVWVYLGCGHTRIEKPFIWAEGFNPVVGGLNLGLSIEDAFNRINHSLTEDIDQKTLWQNLIEEGYDIILIDYDDGGDYIPRTAELIKEVIRWVNIQKHSAGSNEKNVIMGQSMGGVCTNLALKEMEVVDMEDHEVGTFVVFDSPILGVNVPLGAQHSLVDVAHLPVTVGGVTLPLTEAPVLKNYVQILDDAVDLLFTPAARTMIRYFYNGPGVDPNQHLWQEHYEYQWETLGGYPTECEVINIANGSIYGEEGQHNFEPSELIASKSGSTLMVLNTLAMGLGQGDVLLTPSVWAIGGALVVLTGTNVDASVNIFSAPDGGSGVVYFSDIEIYSFWGDVNIISSTIAVTSDKKGIDCAPGGFVGKGNQGLMIENFHLSNSLEPDVWKLETFCFTPTVSVLSYFNGPTNVDFNDPLHDFSNFNTNLWWLQSNSGLKSYTAFEETVQFTLFAEDNITPIGQSGEFNNTAHTWFTNSNTQFMHYHFINGANELDGLVQLNAGTLYNFGTFSISSGFNYPYYPEKKTINYIDHSISVSNTTLGVNSSINLSLTPDGINYPFPYPQLPTDNSSFLVTIGNGCNNHDPVTVTIDDGGLLVLGDGSTRTGALHVYDGHKIIIKSGGVLDLKEGSTLKLKAGADLILEPGSTVYIRNGARLITEYGSNIYYHPGAEIHLLGSDAVLEMEGQLHLLPDANFELLHAGIASGLFVIKNPQGLLVGGDNSSFKVTGDGPNDFMLAIMEGANLASQGNMTKIHISNCTVALRSGNLYNIQSHVPFVCSNVNWDAQPNAELTNHPKIYVLNKGQFTSSEFNNVAIIATAYTGFDPNFLLVSNCDFNSTYSQSEKMIDVNGGNFKIYHSTFSGFSGTAVNSANLVSTSNMQYNEFNGVNTSTSIAVFDNSAIELIIRWSDINLCALGVQKYDGKLKLRCNSFNQNHVGVKILNGCYLEMTAEATAGYNVFTNIGLFNIWFDNALYANLQNGYNSFDDPEYSDTYLWISPDTFICPAAYLG